MAGVRWMRVTKTRNGRGVEAIRTISGLAAFVEQQLGLKLSIYLDAASAGGTLVVMADLPDMGAAEQALRGLMASPEYIATMDAPATRELFIDGSTQDSFLLRV
jgi:hypothetical protein